MNDLLFIPKKLRVGYNERKDTYTGRLAYVIYFDNKGVLRKEKSWSGWIQGPTEVYKTERLPDKGYDTYIYDDKGNRILDYIQPGLPIDDYDNEPLEGFVLNRKAGGHSSGWNHRQTTCRVYDPRGFEFEITIENLLYILEHATSTKGKGLEGKFLYAWAGKDLVLLPEDAPEYKSSVEFTEMKAMKVAAKDLVEGRTYKTKDLRNVVYMGKHDYINENYYGCSISREFMFSDGETFIPLKIKDLAILVDATVSTNYANLFDQMKASGEILPFEDWKEEIAEYKLQDYYWGEGGDKAFSDCHSNPAGIFHVKISDGVYKRVQLHIKTELDLGRNTYSYNRYYKGVGYRLKQLGILTIDKDNGFAFKEDPKLMGDLWELNKFKDMGLVNLMVKPFSKEFKKINHHGK